MNYDLGNHDNCKGKCSGQTQTNSYFINIVSILVIIRVDSSSNQFFTIITLQIMNLILRKRLRKSQATQQQQNHPSLDWCPTLPAGKTCNSGIYPDEVRFITQSYLVFLQSAAADFSLFQLWPDIEVIRSSLNFYNFSEHHLYFSIGE